MQTTNRLERLLDEFKAAGLKVEARTGYYQAQCPIHNDSTPSVTIKEQSSGKITITCHAGCDAGEILKSLGLNYEVLYPEESTKKKEQSRLVAAYPYRDEAGTVLFEAVRFHPKKFVQRVPQPNGNYSWSLKGVRRVIYNLPEVIVAIKAGQPVFLCEGEKDADALTKRNITATTSPMGAEKWRKEYNPFFTNATVIILPDNDNPGRKHAQTVAKNLLEVAKSVRILQLPGLKDKQDVSDWLTDGGSGEELLELAFDTPELTTTEDIDNTLGLVEIPEPENFEDGNRYYYDLFFEQNHRIYSTGNDIRLVADFAINIESIVKDDSKGRIFYITLREMQRGNLIVTETIDIQPEALDSVRDFYRAIRPYSVGEIIQKRHDNVTPLAIFKWLLNSFDKPIVRRPDHLGFIQPKDHSKRPFWLFGNALICPPYKSHKGQLILANETEEFIVNKEIGFSLPTFESIKEKEELVPIIQTDLTDAERFMGEVKANLLTLIGGGDPSGRAKNYAKILLGYVIYHLYEKQLFYANDMNGHTCILYVHGPKGTGKSTYFNTILRAFFGLHKTKNLSGNNITIAALENQMGYFSQLPVVYDEYNPEESNASKSGIDYQNINGYYHKISRTVSDIDRSGRNKFTPIRSTLSFTSNFMIDLDVAQADATQSRLIYFEYRKEFRSNDNQIFGWFEDNLNNLSRVTAHLLLNQTDAKREAVIKNVRDLYHSLKEKLDGIVRNNPNKYVAEHRLTDNYTRILGCYELIFGQDDNFRSFIESEILARFADAREQERDNALLSQLAYMASSGRIKHIWHYYYNNNSKELFINLNLLYESYVEFKRDRALNKAQFSDVLLNYFAEHGGHNTASKKWYGSYFDASHNRIEINKTMHSHIINYYQLTNHNQIKDIFIVPEDSWDLVKRAAEPEDLNKNNQKNQNLDFNKEAPF